MIDRRRLALVQALLAGLTTLAALVVVFESGNAAGQSGRELNLANNGWAWELNSDDSNHLWLSDYQAGEIWHLNPATDVYTVYRNLTGASDGRLDANGDLWWVNYDDYNFGRLDLGSNLRTIWPLTGTVPGNVTGLNFDDQGRVWIPDLSRSDLYRFDPQAAELCHYQVPNNSEGNYILSRDGYLWLADWKLPYIYRIDPTDGSYVQWLYYRASDTRGMAFDDNGHLWWGGYLKRPALFRLDPDTNLVTYYTLPGGVGEPVMVDTLHDYIWYSDYEGRFGRLNPKKVAGTEVAASRGAGTLTLLECYQDWQPLSSATTMKSTSSANWSAGVYSTTGEANGWQTYQLPERSANKGPWGIRAREDGIWVVDQERQQLINVPWQAPADVVACKVEDQDGDLATAGDRTPLQNWPIDLRIDGVAQAITQTTGLDGCVIWESLAPGLAYGAQEALPDGWLALTGATHDFGLAEPGGVYSHTFVNTEQVSISACKVEDEDGDPATADDQTPLENWPVDLRIDGVAQALTQTTGLDGCATWAGLDPGPAYGAQEALPEGWLALTGASHDFGPATSGGVYTHTFANARQVSISACKVEDEDGDPATVDDRTALQNWAIDLRVDGVTQAITQTTGLDGCVAWDNLAPGSTYGVQEEAVGGWLALTGVGHDFGPATSGGVYSHTFVNTQQVLVSACKVEDEDGSAATADDQTPLQNWPIDLRIDGVAQAITRTTGLDGCATWAGLDPGPAYGVQEALPGGWLALTDPGHDFGLAAPGRAYTYTFVNTQQVSISACKVEDEDGNPATGDDQTPLQNWPIDLRIDGVAQGITQSTGLDGCATWDGLAPGLTYGLQEALPDGWLALTGTSHDFSPATSGALYSHTFVNTQQVSISACKVEDEDGDPVTTGDRTPLQNWPMDLRIEGVAQAITQTTGLDGCATWSGLAPGLAYGVQEGSLAGWLAIVDASHDFGPATSAGVYTHTFANTRQVLVSACKVEDEDGDPATTGDRTPLQNWPIDLRIDGVAQAITQTTGLDGCVTWDSLAPGLSYGVQEEMAEGWLALTAASHDFGPATAGEVFSHTFVNTRQVSISACKVEDEDGTPATVGDWTPLQNWPVDLRIDGVAQAITQTTGLDGCATWAGLEPGPAYGVQEALPDGWLALTGGSHDFGPATSGGVYTYTFANARQVSISACKVEDEDGNLATSDDRTPLENWPIDLRIDGVAQGITQTTGLDGCATWNSLVPGLTYGVQEEVAVGWMSLSGQIHDFPPAQSGDEVAYTFVNSRFAAVTACKLEDADGDLNSEDDQTPLPDWTITLIADGVRQEPGRLTGGDGCFTWDDLAPGKTYGLEETLRQGWLALTPPQIEFDPAVSGSAYQYYFVNMRVSRWFVYLPMLIRR